MASPESSRDDPPSPLLGRLNLEDCTVDLFREKVNQSVPTLADVTNTLFQLTEEHFAAGLPHLVVEHDTLDSARSIHAARHHAPDHQVAFPCRKLVARVEQQARRRDAR